MGEQNTQETIRHLMEELSSDAGGSLVKRLKKQTLSDDNAILFVGLGGMGCKTVNQIKKIYQTEYEQNENVRFLAVDTSLDDLKELTVGHPSGQGYLVSSEKFEIFDNLLIAPPATVRAWLSPHLDPIELDATGAKQTRQIGRIMLCGTNKYSELRVRIDAEMNEFFKKTDNKGEPCIILIAGLAGGTGSGTFIDVSYMIQLLCQAHLLNHEVIHFFGTFYTADVQENVPDIKKNPVTWNLLKRNCYAALKELDYFMNVGSNYKGEKAVYQLLLPGGETVSSALPIFDCGRVFLVSAANTLNLTSEIIERTARALLYMQQEIPGNSYYVPYPPMSAFSNVDATIKSWGDLRVGKEITGQPIDNCKAEYCEFPAWMNYCYAGFGVNTVYFPRDEIMAYCANTVMEKLLAKWDRIDDVTQDFVNQTASAYGMGGLDQLVWNIKQHTHYSDAQLTIPGEQYPVQKTLFGIGKAVGMDETMNYATQMAESMLSPFNTPEAKKQIAAAVFVPFRAQLENPDTVMEWGPFAIIALLSGVRGRTLRGCLQLLEGLAGQPLTEEIERQNGLVSSAMQEMKEAAAALADDRIPSDEDVRKFVSVCEDYAKIYAEFLIVKYILGDVIAELHREIHAYNGETYEIFVPILSQLAEMLNQNSTIVASPEEKVNYRHKTFSMDAVGLDQNKAMREKFQRLFKGYVNDEMTSQVAQDFISSMFSNRAKWKNYIADEGKNTSTALNDEIRNIFNQFFGPFVSDTLEKFLVLAYAPGNLDAAGLDRIWNADRAVNPTEADIRDNAIHEAAQSISVSLSGGDTALLRYTEDNADDSLLRKQYVILLSYTPRLNAQLAAVMPNASFCYIGDDYRSEISAVTFCNPAAIPLIHSVPDYAKAYFNAGSPGVHLEEGIHNWRFELPEVMGMDAEQYWTCPETKNRTDLSIGDNVKYDRTMYAEIRELVDFGLENGFIYDEAPNAELAQYVILSITDTTDDFASFYKNVEENPDDSFVNFVQKTAAINYSINVKKTALLTNNPNLQKVIREVPENPRKLKNLYRAVRADMRLVETLRKTVKFYRENDIFERIAKIKDKRMA